ncbi:small GTPase superfamily, ARF type [Kipferlia bialata]|uniref:Small GTPase superfamily, ARF type n=1 Tax=Kipferlia bialata TaxID=797122 RepID=A0A9K3CX65_9EUKA|nr:small GTPase superfamily, ARF type [Kipferlia bialata]|eukprot:g6377.t1
MTVFDMSGQGRYRNLWTNYLSGAEAVLFVVDSSDILRLCVVKDELSALLTGGELKRCPIAIFANKMDLPGALPQAELARRLGLTKMLRTWKWSIFATNALTGEGLEEGAKWLSSHLNPNHTQ